MSLREEKKQQTRLDILAVARDLIDRYGYENAKMRDIAAAAHLSYQTLYNYFASKALILRALLLEDMDQVAAQMDRLIANYQTGAERLLETLHAMNRTRLDVVAQRDRELWRVVAMDLIQQPQDVQHVYQLIDAAAHDKLATVLDSAHARGELVGSVDRRLLGDTLFALGQQSVSRYIIEPSASKAMLLANLEKQTELLVRPYLTR